MFSTLSNVLQNYSCFDIFEAAFICDLKLIFTKVTLLKLFKQIFNAFYKQNTVFNWSLLWSYQSLIWNSFNLVCHHMNMLAFFRTKFSKQHVLNLSSLIIFIPCFCKVLSTPTIFTHVQPIDIHVCLNIHSRLVLFVNTCLRSGALTWCVLGNKLGNDLTWTLPEELAAH